MHGSIKTVFEMELSLFWVKIMKLMDEPLIAPHRLAERWRCGVSKIFHVIQELERSGEITVRKTPTNRRYLSYRDAARVDEKLAGND